MPPAFPPRANPLILGNILRYLCHDFSLILLLVSGFVGTLSAQVYRPILPGPALPPPIPVTDQIVRPARPGAPDAAHVLIRSVTQEVEGALRRLRGSVRVETSDMLLLADEIDYNSDTGDAEARGHVHFEHFVRGEKLDCDRAEYNVDKETGKFYEVSGSANTRINVRPGLLTTQNPFYFQSKWAERLKDRYILHDGFLTDCLIPRPWWRLRYPVVDVIPGERAIARNSWFFVRRVPIFYAPFFYKSLRKEPRRSGFLLPNIGNSSTRGKVLGFGYYWAPSRSFDVAYRGRYFTIAGLSHHVDMRARPNAATEIGILFDGIKDQRDITPSPSGALLVVRAKTSLGKGWEARGELNHLTSLTFRRFYTESFNEAVFSQTHSVGYLTKHWSDYGFYLVAQKDINFQSESPGDDINIRKLPEVRFTEREHEIRIPAGILRGLPLWFSLDSSAGLLRRSQPSFQTRQFVTRMDFAPRVTTAWHWNGINISPSFRLRETAYGSSVGAYGVFAGQNVLRSSREFSVDLSLPALQRTFDTPATFTHLGLGQKVKHVLEPRVTYKNVAGIGNFDQIIRFDEMDVLSNTNQVEFSVVNRLFSKDSAGTVRDFATWSLAYARYFDPTFGGALVPGVRNVLQSSLDITGYSFLNGVRNSSPIISVLRVQSRVGLEWRADYDPVRHAWANSSLSADARFQQVFVSLGHTSLRTDPILAPFANQIRGLIGYGADGHRGWNYGFSGYYDYRLAFLQYAQFQVTYNTDCCGFSVQWRRFELGTRNENQFRVAFAVSNIGSFGTLKRQERVF